MSYRLIYITAPSREEAEKISRALLEKQLIACANIFPEVTSLYRWQGKLEQSAETVVIAKTHRELVGSVIAQVKSLHSHACPCVVSLPIEAGNPEFLEWIGNSTSAIE